MYNILGWFRQNAFYLQVLCVRENDSAEIVPLLYNYQLELFQEDWVVSQIHMSVDASFV